MTAAEGEYIFFVDSDDYLPRGTIPHLLSSIERFGAEVFVFPFYLVDEEGTRLGSYKDEFPVNVPFSVKDDKAVLTGIPSAWNKVCKTDLYRRLGITFPSRVWYEDIRTTPKLLSKAESVVFLDREMYNYLQREGSIMSSAKVEKNVEIIEALRCVTKLSENEPYDKFIARVKTNQLAVAVKINDLSDNMDIRRLPYLSDKDVKRLKKYLKAYKQLTGEPTYSIYACRQDFPNAYNQWSEEDDFNLTKMWCEGATIKELSAHFQRKPGAISSRIKKLELEEKYVPRQ